MDKIKPIGFKAGEKPKRPVIQEDTSASKSYASIAYGISEGEIVGLIDGAKSVYLDGTPVMSVSGDVNIPDVTIQERKGTNDQTHLEGFPAVVNEKQYNNVEMLQGSPFVHYINDTNLDAVGIRFTFGALQSTDPDTGNVSGITIEYAIDVQADGQGYQELLRTSIVGKYSAGYQRYHRVELPQADEGWEVRIRRISPNTTSTYIADKMYLDAVAEILDVKMRYPNTALIGLKFDSERFSNIPKVDFRMRGKIIRVPANYDPVARTYAKAGAGTTNGIWNGQFKMAYTTNPAWIFYDLVLNRRYGLGNRIDASMLDKWSLYSIAQYCDVMVPDGEGGLEPRFTCNVYINNRFEAYDCLMQLAGIFRGIMYWSGTAIIAGCDRPQDPVFTYTRANIIGEFNYSGTRTKDRHSVVMVSFDDPKNNYKTEKEVVSDRKAISEIGIRTKDLAAFACTSRGQAQRAGKWALFKEQLETRIVTFALGMDGYIAPVGRIIEIADPLLAGRAIGGRIAAVSTDKKTITLDRDTEVKVGDRLVLNNEEGEQESRQVTSISGRAVTVAVAFESPAAEHVWAIDSDDLQLMRFTVISVAENRSQDSINFTVTALQHEPSLHEAADYSAYVDRNTYSTIDITTQKAPTEVVISSVNRINQGIDLTDLVISWKQAENAVKYQVQWRRDDGNWIQMPLQYGNQVTVENIYHGVYEAKVVAINAVDVNSLPASSAPTPINSKFAEPAALASLTATGILLGVELNWKFPLYGAQNAAFVEIYWALNSDKSDVKLLGSYAYPTSETTINGLSPHLTLYFQARLVDRNGVASGYTPWVTATVEANPEKLLDILSGHINEGTLDQILKGKIDGALGLAGEANSLASQANAAATNAQNAATQASTKAQEAANAVVQEAIDRAAAIQDGIAQVTTDYRAGDAVVLGELVAYKTSNDSAMATVVQKAESAVAVGSTNSQAISELTGQVQAINNTKLDASVISNYYTKGQADDNSAEIAAGKIESYDANLVIGGTNLVMNTSEEREGSSWVFNEPLTAELHPGVYTISYDLENIDGAPNGSGVGFRDPIANTQKYVWYPDEVTGRKTKTLHLDSYGFTHFAIWANSTVKIKNLKLERGSKATGWSPAPKEIKDAIYFNANALQSTNAEVARVNGEVVATTNSLLGLRSDVDNTSAKLSADYFTKAETTVAIAGKVEEFSSSLEVGGVNTYNHLAPQISNYGGILVDAYHAETPNGLYLVGNQAQVNTLRIENVITSPGWWTVSFYIKGIQNLAAGFTLDICDTDAIRVSSTTDNTWKRVTHTSYVSHVSDVHHFVDIADVDWLYVLIKDIKIEKGNVATAWTPYPKILEDSVANIKSTYVTQSALNSSIAVQTTEITSKLARMSEDNLLQNSDFREGSLKGWAIGVYLDSYSIIRTKGGYLDQYNVDAGLSETFAIHSAGVSSGYVELDQKVTVRENRRYQVSCYAAAHRAPVTVFCYFYRADGSIISNSPTWEPQQRVNPNEALGGKPLSYYKRIYQNVTTPVGTHSMSIIIRRDGGDDAYMFVTRAQMVEIFDENLVPWQSSSIQDNVVIKETAQAINGIEAIKTVTIDNNGVMSGYGLISELKNGQVTSSFGVNANTFYIGSPSLDKKPFVQRNDWSQINGVWVPPGTYIDTAFIANATIGLAHINTASIGSLSALSATIGLFRTAPSGRRTEISDAGLRVYNDAGIAVIEIGDF